MSGLLQRLTRPAAVRRLQGLIQRLRSPDPASVGTRPGQPEVDLGAGGEDRWDMDRRFDALADRLDALADRLEERWGEVDERLQRVGREQVRLTTRLDALADALETLGEDLGALLERTEAEEAEHEREREVELLEALLPVSDALAAAGHDTPFVPASWSEGLLRLDRRLAEQLALVHAEPIDPAGEVFDPEEHRAVGVREVAAADGLVVAVEQRLQLEGVIAEIERAREAGEADLLETLLDPLRDLLLDMGDEEAAAPPPERPSRVRPPRPPRRGRR